MANPIDGYIVFEPDQVLTDNHLNETFDYLDQQTRWTRNKLIGTGIVCGLEIVLKPGIIEITKGCGITSQGYLITQELADYTYYITYAAVPLPGDLPFDYGNNLPFYQPFCSNHNVYRLLTDQDFQDLESTQQPSAVTISSAANFLLNYVVVLFLEAKETDLQTCNMLDCNNAGSTMAFTVRPLLVAIADLADVTADSAAPSPVVLLNPALTSRQADLLPGQLSLIPQQVSLKRFNVPYTALNTTNDVLNAFVNLVDDTTLTQISNAYINCYQQYSGLVNVTTNPFAGMLTTLQGYRNLVLNQNPVYIQYFYDLVDDLIKAYFEFTDNVSVVSGTCCPDENLFPLHLILGSASAATDPFSKDSYRNYFNYSALFSQTGNGSSETIFLFNRMVILVNTFTVQSQALQLQATLRVTPSRYEFAWLSERAIPYYYNLNVTGSELYKYWNYEKTSAGRAAYNLSYNAGLYSSVATVTSPLLYDIERFNFFRVEGHIGQNYSTVLSNILNQQLTYNLPFDVVAISADQLQSTSPLPLCNMNDLNTDYNLIMTEVACKIHLVFCFITKLPYLPVANTKKKAVNYTLFETTAPTALKFSAFKLNTDAVPLAAAAVSDTYQKGDFMGKYCAPPANTIGSGYLSALSSTGVFTNPITMDQSNPITVAYYYLFEFVDAVEELMYVFQTNTLAQLDITAFSTTCQAYLTDTLITLGILTALTIEIAGSTGTGNAQFVTLTEDTELGLLIEEMGLLTNICIDERVQVLKTEYTNRLTNYQQQLNFLNYCQNHPGLEHKAGVPKGGTLVLVYHSGTADTSVTGANAPTTANANIAASDRMLTLRQTSPVLATFNDSTLELIRSFVNDCNDAPAATKQTIIGILNQVPPQNNPTYPIADGAVIADFYIPYLCCSDCPPIAYVLPQSVAPVPVKPVITMGNTFCSNDTNAEPISVSLPGGTFNTVKGLDGSKLTFTPSAAGVGKYQIIYTSADGVASDPAMVTVLATPVAAFSFKMTDHAGNKESMRFFVKFAAENPVGTDTYNWTFGKGFPETAATGTEQSLIVEYSPSSGQIDTEVSLTVSNGNCQSAASTTNFIIDTNGVVEAPASHGRFLSGLKNLFTKKD